MGEKIFKSLVFLVFLLLFPIPCLALPEITLNPSLIDVQVYKDVGEDFTVEISNVGDQDIESINFTYIPDFTFPDLGNLSANQSINYTFNVKTDRVFQDNFESIVSFYYVSGQDYEGVDVEVNITEDGFFPNNFSVFVGDKLIFRNVDSVGHTVTEYPLGSGFDHDISSGGVLQKEVDSDGIVVFYDKETGFMAQWDAQVHDTDTLAHNSDLDVPLHFSVNSILKESNFTVEFLDGSDLSVAYNGSVSSIMKISDYGGNGLFNVQLSSDSDWISFIRSGFNVDVNSYEYVEFSVNPDGVDEANQTGRVYDFKITVGSDNSGSESFDVGIFIEPYDFVYNKTFLFNIVVDSDIQAWIDFYCFGSIPIDKLTDSQRRICERAIRNVTVTKLQIENASIPSDVDSAKKISDKLENLEATQTKFMNIVNKKITNIANATAFMVTAYTPIFEYFMQEKKAKISKRQWGAVWWVLKWLLYASIGFMIIMSLVNKVKNMEALHRW